MPYIVDCCHSYATVGEMVVTMKKHWGEFREPTGL
jgi:methylmalonyl-CoA mutase N-terminal domain/subunit